MVSSGGKNNCYTTTCEHDPNSNPMTGNSTPTGGGSSNGSGDHLNATAPPSQAIAADFQQTSVTMAQTQQLQSPAGAMTVLVRGANSQSSLQVRGKGEI